jgi:hypothetical protein
MAAISSLTNKCILLNKGKVQKEGPTQNVIEHYLKDSNEFQAEGVIDLSSFPRPTNKVNLKQSKVIFSKAYCLDTKGQFRTQFLEEEPIEIKYEIEVRQPVSFLEIQNSINTLLDIRAFAVLSDFNEGNINPGLYQTSYKIDPNYLRPGDYYAGGSIYAPDLQDGIKNAVYFKIEPAPEKTKNKNWAYPNLGVVRLPYKWKEPLLMEGSYNDKN